MLNQIPSFLSSLKPDSIKCSYHKGNTASSFCMDCNAFICLDSTCGHPHVFHSVENINTMISSLIIPTLNSLVKITQSKNSSSPNISNEDSIFYSITKYIDEHLLDIKNLQDIANELNHNYSYLSRIFKSKFGKSIHEYFSMQKISYAKRLIEEDKMSLTEISEFLNYSSVYVFSRSFKNIEGISPQTYKNNIKG